MQLCEHGNPTLEDFVVASRLSAKFDCPVACQKFCDFKWFSVTEREIQTSSQTLVGSQRRHKHVGCFNFHFFAECTALFTDESLDAPLHVFDPTDSVHKFLAIPSGQECRINPDSGANRYLNCDKGWYTIWSAAVNMKFGRTGAPRDWISGDLGVWVSRTFVLHITYEWHLWVESGK